jgi:hypothetical protein
MNIHIQTRYTKWSGKQWFFITYRSGQELHDFMLWGRGFAMCIAGHVLTLRIHWRIYP